MAAAVSADTRSVRAPYGYRPTVIGLFAVAAVVHLVLLSKQWFFYDEWAYLDPDVEAPGRSFLTWLFTPHNEHTIVWTRLWFQGVLHVDGMNHYVLYGLPVVVLNLVVAASVLVIARRVTRRPWLAALCAVPILFMGAGTENLMWAGQSQFILPVALVLGWIALTDSSRLPGSVLARTLLAAGFAVVGALSSLVYLPLAVALAVYMVLRRQWWPAAVTIAIPVLQWGIARVVFDPVHARLYSAKNIWDYLEHVPQYVWAGFSAPLRSTLHSPELGYVVLGVTVVGVLVLATRRRAASLAWTLLGAIVLFFLVTGYGRLALGPAQAESGRYAYIAMALIAPVWALLLAGVLDRARRADLRPVTPGKWSAAVLVGTFAVLGATLLLTQARADARLKSATEDVVRAAAAEVGTAVAAGTGRPEPAYAPDLTATALARYVAAGYLSTAPVRNDARAQARVNLGWAASPAPSPNPASRDCASVTPSGSRPLDPSIRYLVTGPSGATVQLAPVGSAAGPTRVVTLTGATVVAPVRPGVPPAELRNSSTAAVTVCATG